MANQEHVAVVKQSNEAISAWLEQYPDQRLELNNADLRGANLRGANLRGANLIGANLREADLREANLGGANLRGANLREADLREANLREANLLGANLLGAYLIRADLTGADLTGADLSRSYLVGANLGGANLGGANLGGANLGGANLREANLREANLREANLASVRGAYRAYGLATTRFTLITHKSAKTDIAFDQPSLETTPTQAPTDHTNDAFYFEACIRLWPERWLDWEQLRVVGRLPLFGASYTALILIPIVFYGLALYDDQVVLVRAWAEQIMVQPDHLLHSLASLVLTRLRRRLIPQQLFLLLLSTVLLAIGATLYTLFCPSRVKEFSRDQWCDQIGRSLLHYWPFAWKHRLIRLLCALCYTLGGAGAFWVLGTKVWNTARFILKHSAFN